MESTWGLEGAPHWRTSKRCSSELSAGTFVEAYTASWHLQVLFELLAVVRLLPQTSQESHRTGVMEIAAPSPLVCNAAWKWLI